MKFTDEQILAKAKELHAAERYEGCPRRVELSQSWLEYGEVALQFEAELEAERAAHPDPSA